MLPRDRQAGRQTDRRECQSGTQHSKQNQAASVSLSFPDPLSHLAEAKPRWEPGLALQFPPHTKPFVISSHPFSCASSVKPVLGSRDLVPMFPCFLANIAPSAMDVATLLILQGRTLTTVLVTIILSSFCSSTGLVSFRDGLEQEQEQQLVANFNGLPGQPGPAKCFTHPKLGHRDPGDAGTEETGTESWQTLPSWLLVGQPGQPNSRAGLSPSQGGTH